jgi:hypothetical protein
MRRTVDRKINTETAKASKDNDNHVDEVMEQMINTIINEINKGTRHLDTILQETHQSMLNSNKEETEYLMTTLQENQLIMIEAQSNYFSKTLEWLDNSMQSLMSETKKEIQISFYEPKKIILAGHSI